MTLPMETDMLFSDTAAFPGTSVEAADLCAAAAPSEDAVRLLRHVLAMNGELCQIYTAADAHAVVASALSRLVTTDIALSEVAEHLAGAEISRRQLCLIFPELPGLIGEARREKLRQLMLDSEYPFALDL